MACSNSAASERQEETQDSVAVQSEEVQDIVQETTEHSEAPQETEEQTKTQQETMSETESPESVSTGEQEEEMGTRTLVVYFSCIGTTKPLAEYAAEILGADLAYYTGGRADQEQNNPSSVLHLP